MFNIYAEWRHIKVTNFRNPFSWNVIKQSHLWRHNDLKNTAEQLLIQKTTEFLDALESLNGCEIYELKGLMAHCCTVILESHARLKEKGDGSMAATFYKVTKENLENLKEIACQVQQLKISESNLKTLLPESFGEVLPELTSLHLIITSQGISETAMKLLSGGNIRSLRIVSDKRLSSDSASKSYEIGCQNALQVDQLDIRNLKVNFKRCVLGLFRIISFKDLRAQNCAFMDDSFIFSISHVKAPATLQDLKGIDIGDCSKVTDKGLEIITNTYRNLEVLNLSNTSITDEGLIKVLHLPIHDLNIARCSKLKSNILNDYPALFANIRTLRLGGKKTYGDTEFDNLFKHAAKLEFLYIFCCPNFNVQVMESHSLPFLHTLWVDANNFKNEIPKQIFSAQKYPNLKVINVTGSPLQEIKARVQMTVGDNSHIKLIYIEDKFVS